MAATKVGGRQLRIVLAGQKSGQVPGVPRERPGAHLQAFAGTSVSSQQEVCGDTWLSPPLKAPVWPQALWPRATTQMMPGARPVETGLLRILRAAGHLRKLAALMSLCRNGSPHLPMLF